MSYAKSQTVMVRHPRLASQSLGACLASGSKAMRCFTSLSIRRVRSLQSLIDLKVYPHSLKGARISSSTEPPCEGALRPGGISLVKGRGGASGSRLGAPLGPPAYPEVLGSSLGASPGGACSTPAVLTAAGVAPLLGACSAPVVSIGTVSTSSGFTIPSKAASAASLSRSA